MQKEQISRMKAQDGNRMVAEIMSQHDLEEIWNAIPVYTQSAAQACCRQLLEHIAALTEQRDELLKAAEPIADFDNYLDYGDTFTALAEAVRKVKEGK